MNDNMANIIDALSLIVGIQNLYENREQSKQNDIQAANDAQSEHILNEISERFNELFERIWEQSKTLQEQSRKIDGLLEKIGDTNRKE